VIVVSSVFVLLAGFGSGERLLTWAVLSAVPVRRALAAIVTVALPPLGISPRAQVTVPFNWEQLPAVDVTETKRRLVESTSVSCTVADA
jgi:hypothetical protein